MSNNQPHVPYLTGFDAMSGTYHYAVEFHSTNEEAPALAFAKEHNGNLTRKDFGMWEGFLVRYSTGTQFDERAFYDALNAEYAARQAARDNAETAARIGISVSKDDA